MKNLTYADSGVDISIGNKFVKMISGLADSTARPGADGKLGGFGGVFDLAACKYHDPLLVAANDGVGTKLKIAIDSGIHDFVGIDLVAMCVNDLIVQGAEPLFFLDYLSCGKLNPDEASTIVRGISEGCKQAGAALIGGETAEMPGLYSGEDYDLAGFSVGIVERKQILPRTNLQPGDVLLGLASSGLHSNGFSLVRKILEISGARLSDKSPFDGNSTLANSLLEPTRIYVKSILRIRSNFNLKAIAHITGGGMTENLPRVLPEHLAANVNLNAIPCPEIFIWLQKKGNVASTEMLRTFNCGVGMCLVCDRNSADELAKILEEEGETTFELGELVDRNGDQINFKGYISGW